MDLNNLNLLTITDFIKVHKKTFVTILIVIILSLILTPIIIFLLNHSWFPLTHENLLADAPSNDLNRFKYYIEDELKSLGYDNITDATIREGSVVATQESFSNGSTYYTLSFLVDIDSILQTYAASISWYNQPSNADDTLNLSCPKISESKYPDSYCQTFDSRDQGIDLWLPHELTLDTGEKAVVKDTTIEQNGKTLQIYLYSCDDPNPPLKATEEVVKSWVEDTVKDPLADKYQYHVRYGYCPNDPY